jgi:hypothetical protein
MSLYYFHIRNGFEVERDPNGTELPDLETAHAEALVCARELAETVPEFNHDTVIEIGNETGHILRRVPFTDVIGPMQQGPVARLARSR